MELDFRKTANKVSIISIVVNIALSAFKLAAGILANSSAMISDAIHSASDVFATFIVIIGIGLATKESDKEHPYGHERLECVAAIILSIILMFTGIGIGSSAAGTIISGSYADIEIPVLLALIAAVTSIAVKEAMYWYTRYYAVKFDSNALMADAWHHRSDALSSIGALVGIAAARMGYPVADSIASLVIFVFIAKASIDIFRDAIDKMVDRSCDDETEAGIREVVLANENVIAIDMLQTRMFGNKIYVDVEIRVDGSLSLKEGHDIAEAVHDDIENNFSKIKHIMVHVNPD